jgi:hypothetical protein
MRKNLPDLWQRAVHIEAAIYQAVKERFTRTDRYDVGVELKQSARAVVTAARKAFLTKEGYRRTQQVQAFSDEIDELKDRMQHASEVGAFRSGDEFEMIARLVRDLGKRCGGWLNEERKNSGQNDRPPAGQRAQTLSARAAPTGANP